MANQEKFLADIAAGYSFKGETIVLGGAMLDGHCHTNALVQIPLKMMNRHGLIAGATGSGKTKTLQVFAEQLSAKGVPVMLMDIKGDLSGVAAAGTPHPKITERHALIGLPHKIDNSPVEFLSLSNERGARLRATVSEFGPVLFSKILGLNDNQGGVVAVVFKYCDDKKIPLLDLKDFKKTLQYLSNEGKNEIEGDYGRLSTASVGTILRKVVEIEQQGAELFFGETSFEVDDLCRIDDNGRGMVSIVRLTDIQDRPKLFSSFMLQMLAEIYGSFPEEGDIEQPKLVLFIDEAHLVFQEASSALLTQLETVIKLIRSKGVGVFFVTQNPADIPSSILGQLGLKVQHALRAFTANDRKAIKLAAQNYPETPYYDVEELLTNLGIGEAFVTALNEKGIPTPLVHTLLRAPQSRMDVLTDAEIDAIINQSKLVAKYNRLIDRESAYEILGEKIAAVQQAAEEVEAKKQEEKATPKGKPEKSFIEKVAGSSVIRQVGRSIASELTRGLLGVFGLGGRRKR